MYQLTSRLPSQFRVILVHNKEQPTAQNTTSQIISNALPTPLTDSKIYASITYLRINNVFTQRYFFCDSDHTANEQAYPAVT
jgi:hypothetical protein